MCNVCVCVLVSRKQRERCAFVQCKQTDIVFKVHRAFANIRGAANGFGSGSVFVNAHVFTRDKYVFGCVP